MEINNVSVVIVTFKSEEKIFNCIESIPKDVSIVVVENSNKVAFKQKIEKKYENVTCILTGANKGYAVANNIGLNFIKTKYALVLNPDTVVDENAIQNFFITVKSHKDFWLIGPGNDQAEKESQFKNDNVLMVKNLKGFAIFFNIEKFEKTFFDENFFLYFEEIDLCNRVIKKGGKIYLDKNIIIKHEGSNSVSKTHELEFEKNRNWHWMWSTFYFQKKHKGFFIALLKISPKFISSICKILIYQIALNNQKRDIYISRLSGLFNSIIGKKSWYRPPLD